MTPDAIVRLAHRSRNVEGWFTTEMALLFGLLDAVQTRAGITGDLFEIGVHHGKSALFLGTLAADQNARLGVCDLFDSQDENRSKSGYGNRAVFERVMKTWCPGVDCRVFACPSAALTPAELGASFRMFHIDGGHSTAEALADLELGAACLAEGGVMILDDAFRSEWPGVTEAAIAFLGERREFVPVAAGFNKLVLARKPDAAMVQQGIQQQRGRYELGGYWQLKQVEFVGEPMLAWWRMPQPERRPLRQRLRWLCLSHPVLRPCLTFARGVRRLLRFRG